MKNEAKLTHIWPKQAENPGFILLIGTGLPSLTPFVSTDHYQRIVLREGGVVGAFFERFRC